MKSLDTANTTSEPVVNNPYPFAVLVSLATMKLLLPLFVFNGVSGLIQASIEKSSVMLKFNKEEGSESST